MNLWLSLPFFPTGELTRLVRFAEEVGFVGVTVPEHVGVPAQLDTEYPYGKTTELPIGTEFPDPLVLVGALGAVTTRIRFMTYALLLPLRHPVLLARAAATASVLSQGRLDLGVGVGWMREEFDALGIAFETRGARMDEAVGLLRPLWSGEPVAHDGVHFRFPPLAVHPTPPSPVPLFLGGHSDVAIRRAVRHGDGWMGISPTVEELTAMLGRIREEREKAGSQDRPFPVRTGVKGRLTPEKLDALGELGLDALLVTPWQVLPGSTLYGLTVDTLIDALPEFAGRVRPLVSSTSPTKVG